MALSIYFIVWLFVEILLYSFHLAVFILLIAKRNATFKGPFFSIFRTVLAADLLCFVSMAISQKLTLIAAIMNIFQSFNLLPTIFFSFIAYISVMQFVGHLFMTFNRFTIIWFPLSHKRIWNRQWYTFLLMLLPFLSICWRLHEPANLRASSEETIVFSFANSTVGNSNYILSLVIYFSTTLLSAILNFLSFLKFCVRKKDNSSINLNEKHLLIVSVVVFLAQLLRVSFNIYTLLFPTTPQLTLFFNQTLPIRYDIFAWSGSISLFLLRF